MLFVLSPSVWDHYSKKVLRVTCHLSHALCAYFRDADNIGVLLKHCSLRYPPNNLEATYKAV